MQLIGENLTIERGGRRLVEGLSFRLEAGRALLLTGPNGSGKTSLLRTIIGFAAPAGGAIRLEGGEGEATLAEQAHYVAHRDAVKGALTVRENAAFWAGYLGPAQPGSGPAVSGPERRHEAEAPGATPMQASTDAALSRLGLAALAEVPAAWLSAGQRRRLGLARLLLAERPIWLLDEPTVSLDRAAVEVLAGMISEHLARGGIAIAATHVPMGLEGARELMLGDER